MEEKPEEAAMVCPAGVMTLANSIFDMSFFVYLICPTNSLANISRINGSSR